MKENNYFQRGDADFAYNAMTSYEFIFILHFMKDIMTITHDLCQVLQRKSQDILNAITLVSSSKTLIQRKRESGWNFFFQEVKLFCEKYKINIFDMCTPYIIRRS